MKFNQSKLSHSISWAIAVTAGVALAPHAFAQDEAKKEDAKQMTEVLVTGSKIKRADRETAQPVLTLTRDDIQKSGLASVGDILQKLSEAGPSLNRQFNNGGNGEVRIDLRNLGSARTLVLVNGHRWIPSAQALDGAVDLQSIPASMIESIEVLKDGASAIYGSDAIAGVVNVITRANYDGAEANAYFGQFDKGDGTTQEYGLTLGTSSDRGSVMTNIAYHKDDPVFAGDRAIAAVPTFGFDGGNTLAGASSTIPNGRFTVRGLTGTRTLISGTPGTTAANFRPFDGTVDGYNFAPFNYLVTPFERHSLFTQGRYDLFDNISFSGHALYTDGQSKRLLAAEPLVFGTIGSNVFRQAIAVPIASAYNPFGADVTAVQRRMVEVGERIADRRTQTYRAGGEFTGSFGVGDRLFDWNVGGSYTQTNIGINSTGNLNGLRIQSALGPSFRDAAGVARCGTATAVIAGCVPLNVFGGVGTITRDMVNYITFVGHDSFDYNVKNYFAGLSGDVVELPAGMLKFAVGYEYRKEQGKDSPDALVVAGITSGNARAPTQGSTGINEYYFELDAPILKDLPGAELLDLRLAGRHSKYDPINGSAIGSTNNFSAGFQWKPIHDLKLRGNFNQGFRAPSISDLYSGRADSFPQLQDPCSDTFLFTRNAAGVATAIPGTSTAYANCRAAGVPVAAAGSTTRGYQQPNSQIRITVGSNPFLTPEKAKTYTLGFIYNPEFLEGFDVAVDWYRIKITNAISSVGGGFILDQCYNRATPNAAACALITRDAAGNITDLIAAGLNIGGEKTEGVDLNFGYKLPEFDFGKFKARVDTSYVSKYDSQNLGATTFASLVGNYFDRNGYYRIKSNAAIDWSLGEWNASWRMRFISGLDESCSKVVNVTNNLGNPTLADALCGNVYRNGETNARPDTNAFAGIGSEHHIGSVTYHDLRVGYDAPWDATVSVGVNNAFKKDPPISYATFANSYDPAYDTPGRFWYVQYNQKF
jgi:iron complex outermembrane recepter protein